MTNMTPGTPPPRKGLKGLGIAALLIIAVIVAIFAGYNVWYVAQPQ